MDRFTSACKFSADPGFVRIGKFDIHDAEIHRFPCNHQFDFES